MFIHDREIHFLDEKHCNILLENVTNIKHKLIILLLLDCGLRVSECVTLKIKNFDFKKRLLKVESLKKRDDKDIRVIPLSNRLYDYLAEYLYKIELKPDNYLFPGHNANTHLRRESVNRFLERYKYKLNIPNLHPHALRHTCATKHIANGTPLENIKILLGHKKYDTTLIYTHIPEEILRNNISKVTDKKPSFLKRLWLKLFPKEQKIINANVNGGYFTIGREKKIEKILSCVNRDINTIILGNIGTGKSHLLDVIEFDKKVLKLDDTQNIKKSLTCLILFLLNNDKLALKDLLFGDLTMNKIQTKINRESVKNLCEEIKKLTKPKEYILMIDSLDRLTPKSVTVLEELKDHFTILASAREISLNKSSFLWNFEVLQLKPLSRKDSLALVHKLSYDLDIEDYELFRNHVYEQSNGNPRVIHEIIDRYRKEPVISNEVIREIRHTGALKEIDMSVVVIIFIASLAVLRYLSREIDNESYRFIGGAALVLLIISRYFFSYSKRKLF